LQTIKSAFTPLRAKRRNKEKYYCRILLGPARTTRNTANLGDSVRSCALGLFKKETQINVSLF